MAQSDFLNLLSTPTHSADPILFEGKIAPPLDHLKEVLIRSVPEPTPRSRVRTATQDFSEAEGAPSSKRRRKKPKKKSSEARRFLGWLQHRVTRRHAPGHLLLRSPRSPEAAATQTTMPGSRWSCRHQSLYRPPTRAGPLPSPPRSLRSPPEAAATQIARGSGCPTLPSWAGSAGPSKAK